MLGHEDSITSMITLRDGHTLISASKDFSIRFWDISEEKELNSIISTQGQQPTYLYAFNDYSHFAVAYNDGNIVIYKIEYYMSEKYGRTVFRACKRTKEIETRSPIFVLN